MKIVLVTNNLVSGGAERVLSLLANFWAENNHEVVIIQLGLSVPFYSLKKNIVVESLGLLEEQKTFISKLIQKLKIVIKLAKMMKKYDSSLVISFMDVTNIMAIWSSVIVNSKIIVSERIHCNFLQSSFWRTLRNFSYRFASGIVLLSELDFNYYNFVKKRTIIANPSWLLGNYAGEPKEKIILGVGRLEEQKGFDVFLRAVAKIPLELIRGWKILILGDGKLRPSLKELSRELNLSGILEFLGVQKDVEDYYRRSAIFVSTSRGEGFPNALSEALSMGCACVATNCPTGPSELITHGHNGFLAKVDDVAEVSVYLKDLLSSKELRQKLSKNALISSRRFSIDNITQRWTDFISAI